MQPGMFVVFMVGVAKFGRIYGGMNMNDIEAIKKLLKIYIETDAPVTQEFYQGLCVKALETIGQLEDRNIHLYRGIRRILKVKKLWSSVVNPDHKIILAQVFAIVKQISE